MLIDSPTPPAPFEVVRVTTGLGKSRETLLPAEQLVRAGHRFIDLTRTVDLADELATGRPGR